MHRETCWNRRSTVQLFAPPDRKYIHFLLPPSGDLFAFRPFRAQNSAVLTSLGLETLNLRLLL